MDTLYYTWTSMEIWKECVKKLWIEQMLNNIFQS